MSGSASLRTGDQSMGADWSVGERAYREAHRRSLPHRVLHELLVMFTPYLPGWRLRIRLYRLMGINLHDDNFISRECYLDPEFPELITFEPGAKLSPRVIILCHNSNSDVLKPVRLCADSWVGAGAIIGPGVTVGRGAVIGAGAVVLRDVKPGALVVAPPPRALMNVQEPRSGEGAS